MSMLKRLFRQIVTERSGRRRFETYEVRRLIDRGELVAAEEAIDLLHDMVPDLEIVRTCLCAEVAFRQFRDSDAETLFREALRRVPGLADAHYGLALVMLARGDAALALRHAQFAANKAPDVARFHAQLGLCELELRNFKLAQSALARATRLDPEDKSSWNNYGICLRASGKLAAARRAFEHAIELDRDFAAAARNLKVLELDQTILQASGHADSARYSESLVHEEVVPDDLQDVRAMAADGRIDDAMRACEVLVANWTDDFRPTLELYRLNVEFGDEQSGLDAMQAFLARHPAHTEATAELGKALEHAGEYRRAKPLLQRALVDRPDDVSLLLAMAAVRVEQGRHADAGELVERAHELEPSLHLKGRLAASLVNRCRYEEALALIDQMLEDEPTCADGVAQMQVEAYTQLGRHSEALPLVERELEKHPNHGALRFARATIRLLNEDYAGGWDDYAWRTLGATVHLRMLAFPQWRGEPLEGKRILVLAEQGLGDQVMFASCLPDLLALRPAKVVLEAVNRVAPTLARSFPQCEVVATKQDSALDWVRAHGDMDYFVPIGDLPHQFRRSAAQFPQHQGYLKPNPDRVAYWRESLRALGPGRKIGLSWRGGTEQTRTVVRSMPLDQLARLADSTPAQWICLQYGDVVEGLSRAREAGLPMHYWKDAIDDLDEFAALISALDLVVTVCNSTVHYAGALGKEVWVMAPKVPEWRYGLHSQRMPWYPASRIYRQAEGGGWNAVIDRVRKELSANPVAAAEEDAAK